MDIKPLGDRILIEPLSEKEEKIGNIYIPDTAKEKPHEGTVIAVGEGRITDDGKRIPISIAVGDKVLYGKYSGTELKRGDKEYLIVRETDVLATI